MGNHNRYAVVESLCVYARLVAVVMTLLGHLLSDSVMNDMSELLPSVRAHTNTYAHLSDHTHVHTSTITTHLHCR